MWPKGTFRTLDFALSAREATVGAGRRRVRPESPRSRGLPHAGLCSAGCSQPLHSVEGLVTGDLQRHWPVEGGESLVVLAAGLLSWRGLC